MIYLASLGRVGKKALADKAITSSVQKICGLLPLSPDTTNMDGVILHSKDINIVNLKSIQQAIDARNKDICVVYIYDTDDNKNKLTGVYTKQAKKVTDQVIKDVITEFFSDHALKSGKLDVTSKDDQAASISEFSGMAGASATIPPEPPKPAEEEPPTMVMPPFEKPEPEPEPEPVPPPVDMQQELASKLDSIKEFKDFNLLKQELNRSVMYKRLIEENAEFQGLVQMIEVLDKRIQSIFRDNTLSAGEKFEKIKETTRELSVYRGTYNEVTTNRALDIFDAVAIAAEKIVNEKIEEANQALYKVSRDKAAIIDEDTLNNIIQQRTHTQLSLLNSISEIIKLYKVMDTEGNAIITELDSKIPTSNKYINKQLEPLNEILTPKNSGELAKKIFEGIQNGRLTYSQLEAKLQNVIDMIFEYCADDNSIIAYQQHMIELLKANRVEDVVIVDSVIKHMLNLWIGPRDTGTTATVVTQCGILSRRHNTLLIDLSGGNKLKQYGVDIIDLNTFLEDRIEKQFCCVQGTLLSLDGIHSLIQELKTRLNYYPYVHILLSPEQQDYLDALSPDAYVCHYITDSSVKSINIMYGIIKKHTYANIARKLVVINPAINVLALCEKLHVDMTNVKVITIPNLPVIEACSWKGGQPWTHDSVSTCFEAAFR